MSSAKLAFGVEIELLLKPLPSLSARLDKLCPSKNWQNTFEDVKQKELAAQGKGPAVEAEAKNNAGQIRALLRQQLAFCLANYENLPVIAKSLDFTEWAVLDEVSLDEIPGYCRIEFVSRTLTSDGLWAKEIDDLYSGIKKYCDIRLTTGCSMHVHVSPSAKPRGSEDKWSAAQLRSILKAISYFDDPITKVMPAERKQNPFAMSNMLSDDVFRATPALKKAYLAVGKDTWKPLFDFYDAKIKSNLMKPQAHVIMGSCRLLSWNFEHIAASCGTVEFRRCPGAKSAQMAKHWVRFTLGFIAATAIAPQDANFWTIRSNTKGYPTVQSLDLFVQNGLTKLESASQGPLGPLKEITEPPTVFPAAQLAKKKALLMARTSPYADKVHKTPTGTPTASPNNSPKASPQKITPKRPATPTGK